MHWMIVSAQHHPTHGGIGAYVASFTTMARAMHWDVSLVTRRSRLLPKGARILAIETPDERPRFAARVARLRAIERIRPYRYGLWARAVARKLLEIDEAPDVIEFTDCQGQGIVALTSARVRGHLAGVRMIVHAHTPMHVEESINGADPRRFGRPMYHAWERRAVAAADGLLAPSRGLLQRLGATPPAAVVAPLPVPRLPLSATRTRDRIVVVASAQPCKGIDTWCTSLSEVLRARPRARAVLIGPDTPTGPGGRSMARWSAQLIDADVRDRFRHAGALGRDETLAMLGRASLVVVPSRFESFSYAAAEAILRGRPTLVTTACGIVEHVEGMPVVPPEDPARLAAAQIDMLEHWADAHEYALDARLRLIEAAAPDRIERARLALLREAKPPSATPAGMEAIEAMSVVLREIEALEHAEAAA